MSEEKSREIYCILLKNEITIILKLDQTLYILL